MNSITVTFSGETMGEIYKRINLFLAENKPAISEYVDKKASTPVEPTPQTVEHKPAGSHPKTYEAMRDAIKAIIGCDQEKLSRHKQILDAFEVTKISDIDVKDYPMYWAEVQKL